MSYFVMLTAKGYKPLPLVDLDEDVVLFDSEQEAHDAGRENIIGGTFGYQVFEW